MVTIEELSYKQFALSKFAWNNALQKSLDNHLFLSWEWLTNWWKHYGSSKHFHFVVSKNADDELIAAAPLVISPFRLWGLSFKRLEFAGGPVSDYHTLLVLENHVNSVSSLIKYAEEAISGWDFIHLRGIPENSKTLYLLEHLTPPNNLNSSLTDECYCVTLPQTFADYLQSLSRNFRKDLRNGESRLKRHGFRVDFVVCNNKSEIPKALNPFLNLHKKRWQTKNATSCLSIDPKSIEFYRDVALSLFEKGWLALNFLTLDDEPVAAGYDFVYRKKLYSYLSGFNPDFSRYPIGHLRNMYLVKYAIDNGLSEFDLLRGDESYKQRWNASIVKTASMEKSRSPVLQLIYNSLTNLRSLIR